MVNVTPQPTSYFSKPSSVLDPMLFRGDELKSSIRNNILGLLLGHLNNRYQNAESWAAAWLAGSGVSYNWSADRNPSDLDCLVGIDYPKFRMNNQPYKGLSDQEIADLLNEGFREELQPTTENYMNRFELTFYVNVHSDIRDINPYAAYSLTDNSWTVAPKPLNIPQNPEWDVLTGQDISQTAQIIDRYRAAMTSLQAASNDAARRNAEVALLHSVGQGSALYDEIHQNRSQAFRPGGLGYADFTNYRWQAGKQSGIVQALRKMKNISKDSSKIISSETYGIDLPDASILVRRAATRYAR